MTAGPADVLYYAPGGGAGHLVRGCSICLRLRAMGVRCRIVTNSPFALGVSSITGCQIEHIPSEYWKTAAFDYASQVRPRVIALDSFPWGLRGEWLGRAVPGAVFVYIARRLKVDAYTNMLGACWDAGAPHVANVVLSEPLSDDHSALVSSRGPEKFALPGRILLPDEITAPPVPRELDELLTGNAARLVSHSGTWEETKRLLRAASADSRKHVGLKTVLVAPEPHKRIRTPVFEYFPASRLLHRAKCLVSGAGYNSVAEARAAGIRHVAVPFERKYDDQQGRLDGPDFGTDDGGPAAADFLFNIFKKTSRC